MKALREGCGETPYLKLLTQLFGECDDLLQRPVVEVEAEADEPPFHAPWEGRVHGLMLASALALGGGSLRPYIERMGSAEYLATSPKYELRESLAGDASAISRALRERITDGPVAATSIVSYVTATRPLGGLP